MNVHAKLIQDLEKSLTFVMNREEKCFSVPVCTTSCCVVQSGKPLHLCILQEQLLNCM